MHTVVLLPFLVILTIALISAFVGRGQSKDAALYSYPRGAKIYAWVATSLVFAIPAIFGLFGVALDLMHSLIFVALGAVFLVATMYVQVFKILIKETHVEIKAFTSRSILFNDMQSASVESGGNGTRFLVLRYGKNRRYAISAYIQGFQQLADAMAKNVAKVAQPSQGATARIK